MTILCEPDSAVAAALASALASAAPSAVRTVPDLAAAALLVDAEPDEQMVIVGKDAPIDEVVQFAHHVQAQRPNAAVIVLRQAYEPDTVKAALAAGVREVVPVDNPTALVQAVRRAHADRLAVPAGAEPDAPRLADELIDLPGAEEPVDLPADEPARPSGQVVTVFSPKGGSGKTTIATNLAVALNKAGHRVCLVDLDLEFGDVAISLRLTPVRTLVDAVLTELGDSDEVGSLAISFVPGMDCILAPIEPGEAGKIPVQLVSNLIAQLRERYEFVVIDTPSQFSEHVLAALDVSDRHVLLTNPELPALKNLRLTLDMFDLLGYERSRRSIVFNRDDAAVGLTAADVEDALKNPIAVHVPASRDVPASINRGVPIVSAKPDHPVSVAIRGFAATLAAEPTKPTGRSGRRTRLLRRRAG